MTMATALKVVVEALSKAYADEAITIEQYQAELVKYGIDQIPKQNKAMAKKKEEDSIEEC